MRCKFIFQLNSNIIGISYREAVMSYIKNALTEYENGIYFDKFYNNCTSKNFAFAVKLPKSFFSNENIELLERNFDVFLSVYNAADMIVLYNAINSQRYKPYPFTMENSCVLVNVVMERERKITGNEMICQLAMPLAVRVHNRENNRDRYVIYSDADFGDKLRETVIAQLEIAGLKAELRLCGSIYLRVKICLKS